MKEQPCSFTQELLGGGDRLVACASPRRQEEGERTERGRRGFPSTRSARSRVLTRTSAPYLSYTLASTFLDFFLDAVRRGKCEPAAISGGGWDALRKYKICNANGRTLLILSRQVRQVPCAALFSFMSTSSWKILLKVLEGARER